MPAIEKFLEPISAEQPGGEDLVEDGSLRELDSLVKGKPETQFSPAEEADWKKVKELSVSFFSRSKDLRVGVILCLAWLKDDLSGFRDGLSLVRGLVEKYWDTMYPRLDPEDQNDPTQRINILNNLSAPLSTESPYRFLKFLQQIPLSNSPRLGRYCLDDIKASQKTPEPSESGEKTTPTPEQIAGAFRDTPPEKLEAQHAIILECVALVGEMETLFANAAEGQAPNLERLVQALREMDENIKPYLPSAAASEVQETPAASEGGVVASPTKTSSGDFKKGIQSQEDVILALKAIGEYYKRCEPASPIPFLLGRVQRLVKMDFMQIMNDLAPSSLEQIRVITGPENENSSGQENT